MTSNVLSTLTTLLIAFKFAESTKHMVSIFGDVDFIYHDIAIAADDILGFVYDDADNGFVVSTTCTASEKSPLSVGSSCTVTASASIAISSNSGTGTTLDDFPDNGTNVNVMVATAASTPKIIKTKTELSSTLTVTAVTTNSGEAAGGLFYCNNLSETESSALFTVTATQSSSTSGTITLPSESVDKAAYASALKCFVSVNSSSTALGKATFLLIVRDGNQRPVVLNPNAITDFAVLNEPSVNDSVSIGSKVGEISGTTACPNNTQLTLGSTSDSGLCSGNIITKTKLDGCLNPFLQFIYGSKNYSLVVLHVDDNNELVGCNFCVLTCSKILLGFLLIFTKKSFICFKMQ